MIIELLLKLLLLLFFEVSHSFLFSSENCTWKYIEQPLSHFERRDLGVFNQRICVYSGFIKRSSDYPVLLYTGNESPVEEYVNNTGLIWSLAEKFAALIIFAEHRYFGDSIPQLNGVDYCVSYLTSAEALADYASLCNRVRREWGVADNASKFSYTILFRGHIDSI